MFTSLRYLKLRIHLFRSRGRLTNHGFTFLWRHYVAWLTRPIGFPPEFSGNCPKITTKTIIMVIGDFNAKICGTNRRLETVMGRQGTGQKNANVERFVDCCSSTLFMAEFPSRSVQICPWCWTASDIDTNTFLLLAFKIKQTVLDPFFCIILWFLSHRLPKWKYIFEAKWQNTICHKWATGEISVLEATDRGW